MIFLAVIFMLAQDFLLFFFQLLLLDDFRMLWRRRLRLQIFIGFGHNSLLDECKDKNANMVTPVSPSD